MRVMIRRGFALIGFVAVAGCAGVATDAPARSVLALSLATPVRAACENARFGFAHCAARIREDGDVALAGLPKGYGPQDLWSAYSLTDDRDHRCVRRPQSARRCRGVSQHLWLSRVRLGMFG